MKYNSPVGAAADDPYVDGNRSAGVDGSIVPAAAVEHPQREIVEVITAAGLTPTATSTTQLREAIAALIAAATGGGETSNFLLMTQARARLPVWPEIVSADTRMNITCPAAGTVRMPSGVTVMHRGVYPVVTAQTDFATAGSKTYHLRLDLTTGAAALKDLADAAYNPGALADTSAVFDSTFDNALLARIVTSAGNVATITPLANAPMAMVLGADITAGVNSGSGWQTLANSGVALNWARTPIVSALAMNAFFSQGVPFETDFSPTQAGQLGKVALREASPTTRYAAASIEIAYQDTNFTSGNVKFNRTFMTR